MKLLVYLEIPLALVIMNYFNPGRNDLYIVIAGMYVLAGIIVGRVQTVIYSLAAKHDDNRREIEEIRREIEENRKAGQD